MILEGAEGEDKRVQGKDPRNLAFKTEEEGAAKEAQRSIQWGSKKPRGNFCPKN